MGSVGVCIRQDADILGVHVFYTLGVGERHMNKGIKKSYVCLEAQDILKHPPPFSSSCRSRLADFFTNCQPESRSVSSCLKENYADCLLAYSGLIGKIREKQDRRKGWFTNTDSFRGSLPRPLTVPIFQEPSVLGF